MTLNDLNKKVEDKNKVIIFKDNDGSWCNINIKEKECEIEITKDDDLLFDGK